MKIFEIDNWKNDEINKKVFIKGKKVIMLPVIYDEIILTKGYLPHIKVGNYLMKYCHKCKTWRLLNKFIKNKHAADGYKDTCRDCDNKRRRERYAKTRAVT